MTGTARSAGRFREQQCRAKQGVDWRYHVYEDLWFLSTRQLVPLAELFQQSLAGDLRAALEMCEGDEAEGIHFNS